MHLGGDAAPDPKGLLEKFDECGISGACLFSIDPIDPNFTYEERMDNLFAWTRGYEDRLFPVAWLHPCEENIFDKVRDCVKRGVVAFKFIPNNYSVCDEKPAEVFRLIEELGYPVFFHTGILYDLAENVDYNIPKNWESFVNYKSLRFAMGHCSWPWHEECLSLFGKFNWITGHAQRAANGEPTIYANYPWIKEHVVEKDGKREAVVPEMYLDTTRGAHSIFRRDLFFKLYASTKTAYRTMFGTDLYAEHYDPSTVKGWLAEEKVLLDELGASEEFRENMYCNSLMSFLER